MRAVSGRRRWVVMLLALDLGPAANRHDSRRYRPICPRATARRHSDWWIKAQRRTPRWRQFQVSLPPPRQRHTALHQDVSSDSRAPSSQADETSRTPISQADRDTFFRNSHA